MIKRGFHYNPSTSDLELYVNGTKVDSWNSSGKAGNVYHVNNITGSASASGLSWSEAFDQVSTAIVAATAHGLALTGVAPTAAGFYGRDTILIMGSGTPYTAVATAACNKLDFIGIGDNPRGDGMGICVITGANVADAWSATASMRGNTWYNIQFDASGTSYCAFDATNVLRSRFEECAFMGDAHYNESLIAGLRTSTDSAFDGNTVYRCFFGSNWAGLTSGMYFGGSLSDTVIQDCVIIGCVTNGIIIASDALTIGGVIKDNIIQAVTYGIKSSSAQSMLSIVGNYITSADAINIVAGGTATGEHMCLGNIVSNAGTVVSGVGETPSGA